jgi:alpha-beta hydrolase superfamily lysophospholipase
MDTLRTADGLALYLQEWPLAEARGTVQIVHGLGEHIGRYGWLAGQLNAAGWRVVGHDQRGHGRSEGRRGAIADGASLLADLAQVLDAVRRPGPHVLLGHSMGGLVAARFVAEALAPRPARWSRAVSGLVLSSPAPDPGMNGAQKALLAVLGWLAPGLAVGNGLKPAWLSHDAAVVQAYVDDRLNHDRVTPRLVQFIVDGGACVQRRAAQWTTPTLLLWAGADRCVAPAGSAAFAAAAPQAVLTAERFAGLFHEIFNEPERDDVFSHVARWLVRI